MEDRVFGRRYRVTERIGSGGMAEVFKAVDEVLGRTVAVKVLHPQYAQEPNFVARFRQEAQAAANLSHPSIVNIYDWGRDDDTYYIVMEYVRGTDLKTLVEQEGPLDPRTVAQYGAQVCAALAVAHGYGIIHRDIKPHNIVITPDGTVKVMDFGIARAGNTTMTQTGSVLGTAQYVSPEQAQGRTLSPATDLYSLGVTLYEAVTGRLPFDGDTPVAIALKHVNEEPVPPRRIRPSVPASLEAVILKAMRKDPAERYESAAAMREDLLRVARGEQQAADTPAVAETSVLPSVRPDEEPLAGGRPQIRPVPDRRTNPWVWVAAAVAMMLLGLGGAWVLGAFGGGTVAVPSVVGMSEEEASATVAAAGLTIGSVTTEHSDQYELGLIMRQNPAAGARVKKGTAVDIVVSAGVAMVEVPNVAGMTEADAIAAIEGAQLEVALPIGREYSKDVPEGVVISSEPTAGAQVPKGSKVAIVVSKGTQLVKVPDVTGKTKADAQRILEQAGFKVKAVEAFSDAVAKGMVISQDPGPGVSLDAGGTVTITVSKGPEQVTVPDVTDMTEEDAISTLEALGLIVDAEYVVSPDVGIVLNQNPLPGTKVNKGSTVKLTVGRAP
ncbi:MAG: Stk1 family PASTA domain-containing Ser/Thr kinase [Coriobacteriia bacterium]|nr:Stk1 family PASTA domain-containing Ser/Thr kinase [Coriobacteriia bacterium]